MENLVSFWGLGMVAVIVALVQIVKPFVSDNRWYPIIAVVLGVGLNSLIGWRLGNDFVLSIMLGAVAGFTAIGLYSTQSTIRSGGG